MTPTIWELTVRCRRTTRERTADANSIAVDRLGEFAVIKPMATIIDDHDVRIFAQCGVEDLQRWYAEDAHEGPPYHDGSLLFFGPWGKGMEDRIYRAKREMSTPLRGRS